ncbi:hypothetical protein GQ53DRAFT_355903 [Thozetella sp. PMI_491]|nr:hypothetical protein GQ53DRAFT_355903 [Thozetella sp. PMI_491]
MILQGCSLAVLGRLAFGQEQPTTRPAAGDSRLLARHPPGTETMGGQASEVHTAGVNNSAESSGLPNLYLRLEASVPTAPTRLVTFAIELY